MTAALGDLVSVLGAQAECLRRLQGLLEEQEAALLAADAHAVLDLTERQATVTAELRAIERRRQAVVAGLAGALALPHGPLTLSALLAQIPRAPVELSRLRRELGDTIRRLVALVRRNAFLLERSIGYVGDLLRALVAVAAPPMTTYAASGRTERRTAPVLGVVDRQA